MKRRNPGHELDSIGERFSGVEETIIYGAGEYGRHCAKILKGIGAPFVFADKERYKEGEYLGEKVISPDDVVKYSKKKKSIIVIAMGQLNAARVLMKLELAGLKLGEQIYTYFDFINYYVFLLAAYGYQKVIAIDTGLMVTERCSLRCKNCMSCIPYLNNCDDEDFESFKTDVDLHFKNIDYCYEFGLGGGELFLIKDLDKYISYIAGNYSKRYMHLTLITNGTIVPGENVIKIIKKYGLDVTISNYSSVPGWKEKNEKVIDKLSNNGIRVPLINYDNWVDMGWNSKRVVDNPEKLFSDCGMKCRIIKNGRYVYCVHGYYANKAFYNIEDNENEFSFIEPVDKMELFEFEMGYNSKGYIEMCKHCNGYANINHNYIPVGEQLVR